MEGEITLETELTDKRERLLSKAGQALDVMSSISTEEDTATDNVI